MFSFLKGTPSWPSKQINCEEKAQSSPAESQPHALLYFHRCLCGNESKPCIVSSGRSGAAASVSADKYFCCQSSTCSASIQGVPADTHRVWLPCSKGAPFWTGLQSSSISFWMLCMPQQPSLGMILSKLSAVRSKGITSQPLISQVSLMGMYPDVFINVSSS